MVWGYTDYGHTGIEGVYLPKAMKEAPATSSGIDQRTHSVSSPDTCLGLRLGSG